MHSRGMIFTGCAYGFQGSEDDMENSLQQRDSFRSKWGFILASIGSAVGMGNIWRFPILVTRYGGMTFLIPYFLFVVLVGSTGIIGEFAMGRAAQAGPIGAFGRCAEARTGRRRWGEAIGWVPVLGAMGLAIGYSVVLSWVFNYTFQSVSGGLFAMGTDMEQIVGTFNQIAVQNGWWVLITIAVVVGIMALGVAGGIERANKVMMPILFALLVVLGVYVFTVPGSHEGYRFIFTINPQGLLDPEVWIFAFGQAFFSLSVAGNGSVIYGSYLSPKEDVPSAARRVALFDTLAALLAAFVIVPAIAASGIDVNTVEGGPGLMFIYLVNVMNGMPGGRIIGVLFYVCVLFAGVSSVINMYEVPTAMLQERFRLGRFPAVAATLAVGCGAALLVQPITSQWMDGVSIYICPLGAFLAGFLFFWVAGKDYVHAAVNQGARRPIGRWFYPLAKYGYCVAALVALIAGAVLGGIG